MTIAELIAMIERGVADNQRARVDQSAVISRVRDACSMAGNRNPSDSEAAQVRAAQSEIARIDEELRTAQQRIAQLRAEDRSNGNAAHLARSLAGAGAPAGAGGRQDRTVGGGFTSSRDTYSAERDRRGERSFFADLYNRQFGDVGAGQRLAAFEGEQRAGTTSGYQGLVPPQYLVDQAALIQRAGRPFANSVQSLQLPERGMSIVLPRSTAGVAVTSQATENTSLQNTDEVWNNLTPPVVTIGGQQDVSRQSLERGAPGLDQLIFADLVGAYYAELDRQTVNGSGASNQMLGVLQTAGIAQAAAFGAAVTVATFFQKLAGLVSSISSTRFLPPDHVLMHPRRYAWLLAQVDSQGRPLVTPGLYPAMNPMGVSDGPAYGPAGTILGMQIIVDANVPTAVGTGPEDQVVCYRGADLLLFEDVANGGVPGQYKFEQTSLAGALTVKMIAYGYAAFTAARYPSAVAYMGGNAAANAGLVAPSF